MKRRGDFRKKFMICRRNSLRRVVRSRRDARVPVVPIVPAVRSRTGATRSRCKLPSVMGLVLTEEKLGAPPIVVPAKEPEVLELIATAMTARLYVVNLQICATCASLSLDADKLAASTGALVH